MNKFSKKIISIFATTSMLLNVVSPIMADTITVSGNGAEANSVVGVTKTDTTTVSQTNTATVVNNVTSSSETGGNVAGGNTNGGVAISTGNATNQVSIDNMLNSNSMVTACCDTASLSVLIEGNGAGEEEHIGRLTELSNGPKPANTVQVAQTNDMTVVQANTADVANAVKSEAETGDNWAGMNTGGDVVVLTGNADMRVGVATTANANTATVGSLVPTAGHASVDITKNGAESVNGVSLVLSNTNQIGQTNSAKVVNDVDAEAETGDNDADKNTNGKVWVGTGDASTLVGVETKANFNWADINCCGTFDVDAEISKNGADSYNTMALTFVNAKDIVQANVATVDNRVRSESETGDNDAYKNTGDDVKIMTGNAQSIIGVDNMLNFNHASLDCCVTDLTAVLEKNGAESENGILYTAMKTAADYQTNGALLSNLIGGKHGDEATTGDNAVGENTGDPEVYTGDAVSLTHVANTANTNEVGSHAYELPDFDFEFNFSLSWVSHLLSLVQW